MTKKLKIAITTIATLGCAIAVIKAVKCKKRRDEDAETTVEDFDSYRESEQYDPVEYDDDRARAKRLIREESNRFYGTLNDDALRDRLDSEFGLSSQDADTLIEEMIHSKEYLDGGGIVSEDIVSFVKVYHIDFSGHLTGSEIAEAGETFGYTDKQIYKTIMGLHSYYLIDISERE